MSRPNLRLTGLVVSIALAASACGGPRLPVSIGMREYPTDVRLADAERDADGVLLPAPRPDPFVVAPRTPVAGPPGPAPTLPPPPEPACPAADPLQIPVLGAPADSGVAPVEASHTFRVEGGAEVAGEPRPFPEEAVREVRRLAQDGDGYTFEVAETMGDARTVHTYRAFTESVDLIWEYQAPPGPGIFITRTVRQDGDGPEDVYNWNPPLKILPFPALAGDEWEVVSTALGGQATIAFRARIGVPRLDERGEPAVDSDGDPILEPRLRVDACGENLDAWAVQLGYDPDEPGRPAGLLAAPGTTLSFLETIGIATQFGGLPIFDHRIAQGTTSQGPVASERTVTINAQPEVP